MPSATATPPGRAEEPSEEPSTEAVSPADEEQPVEIAQVVSEKDEVVVKWEGENDPENPQNWSTAYKSWLTLQLSLLAFAASLASSITSPANGTIAEYIGVSDTVVVLTVSLYV